MYKEACFVYLTRNFYEFVSFGRAGFAGSSKNCAKHLHKVYLIENIVLAL